jgi:hypothetical protein
MSTLIQTSPVLGNENFKTIVNQARQIQTANISSCIIQNLSVENIKSQYIWNDPSPANVEKLLSVIGHSSSSYSSMASGDSQFLNINPGQPSATTVAGGILTLPPNATIVGAYAIDATLAGAVALLIGTDKVTGSAATSSNNILATLTASLNTGTQVTAQTSLATAGLGTAGIQPVTGSIQVPSDGTTGVSYTVIGGPITATSGLKVTIFYLLTPPPGTI